jgi:hypothetical protein
MPKSTGVRALLLLALLALAGGSAQAEPGKGFSVFGGLASHSQFATIKPAFGGGTLAYSSAGLSIGVDYQFIVAEGITINPFLVSSSEATDLSGLTAGHGILGVELRYWPGDFFVGAHFGSYSEVLIDASGASIGGGGFGAGLSLGGESDGGITYQAQVDRFTVGYSDSDVDVSAFRLQIGYRWK